MTWACVQATGETTMLQMLRRWRGGRRAKAPSVGDQEAPTRRRRVVAATNAKAQASFCTGAHVGGGQEPQQRIQPVIPTATLSAMAGGPAIAPDHQTVDAMPEVDMQKIMTPTFDALPGLDTAPGADTAALLVPLPAPTPIAPKAQPIAPTPTPTRTNPFAGIMPQALEPAAAFFGVAGIPNP